MDYPNKYFQKIEIFECLNGLSNIINPKLKPRSKPMMSGPIVELYYKILVCYCRISAQSLYEPSPYSTCDESVLKAYVGFIKKQFDILKTAHSSLINSNPIVKQAVCACITELNKYYALYTIYDIIHFEELVLCAKKSITESLNQENMNPNVTSSISEIFENINDDTLCLTRSMKIFNELSADFTNGMFELFRISRPKFWTFIKWCFRTPHKFQINVDVIKDFDIIEYPDFRTSAPETAPETNIQWLFKNSITGQEILTQISLRNFVFVQDVITRDT